MRNQNQANFAILPRFESPGTFRNGMAPVRKEGQWGYIDKKGNWIIEPRFTAARSFREGFAAVRTPDGWGYINTNGAWHVFPQFDRARSYHEGRAAVQERGKWTFLNSSGATISQFIYDWVDNFQNKRAVVSVGDRKGFINRTGNFSIQAEFRDAGPFSEGRAPVMTEEGWVYIDRSGDTFGTTEFDWASSFKNGRARVLEDNQWKLIQNDKDTPVSIDATFVSNVAENGTVRFKRNGKVGFLNTNLEPSGKPQFEQAFSFSGRLTPAKKAGLWGYVDSSGDWIIHPKFNAAGHFNGNLAPVKVKNQWGYIVNPMRSANSIETVQSSYWVDTGLESVNRSTLNDSLIDQFPTWRQPGRDRYVRVLSTPIDHWTREQLVPQSNFGKPNAKYEVTRFPYREPTYLQNEAAEQLFWRSLRSALENDWFTTKVGLRDGFGLDGKGGVDSHFFNEKYFQDQRLLVPDKTETLLYHGSNLRSSRLSGMMYYNTNPQNSGPQIGGPLTIWHFHVFDDPVCHEGVLVQPFDSKCKNGTRRARSPEMIHTWFIDHPGGPFATQTNIPDLRDRPFSLAYRLN